MPRTLDLHATDPGPACHGPWTGGVTSGAMSCVPCLVFGGTLVIVPERRERLGHGPQLDLGQAATELALDQDVVVDERRVMTPVTLSGQDHPDAPPVAGDRFATDQSSCLDPVDEAGQPAPREQGSCFELLHP